MAVVSVARSVSEEGELDWLVLCFGRFEEVWCDENRGWVMVYNGGLRTGYLRPWLAASQGQATTVDMYDDALRNDAREGLK